MMAQAWRRYEAGLVALFEHATMPVAIFRGAAVLHPWPDRTARIGIALVCGGGLYMPGREATRRERQA